MKKYIVKRQYSIYKSMPSSMVTYISKPKDASGSEQETKDIQSAYVFTMDGQYPSVVYEHLNTVKPPLNSGDKDFREYAYADEIAEVPTTERMIETLNKELTQEKNDFIEMKKQAYIYRGKVIDYERLLFYCLTHLEGQDNPLEILIKQTLDKYK